MTITREDLGAALEAGAITGEVATPRENNLDHIRRFLAGERQFDFGVELTRDWDFDSVFDLMVNRCGLRPERDFTEGVDTISTQRCIEGLGALGTAVEEVAAAGGRILFATGHPAGLMPVHMAVADWARSLGAQLVEPDGTIEVPALGGDLRRIRGVWFWQLHGGIPHTHLTEPMERLLAELVARGEPAPDLVVADHGWAGRAGSAGLRTIGYADCNDPGLFVAEAQGQLEATIPLDDDVVPTLYEPLIDYVVGGGWKT